MKTETITLADTNSNNKEAVIRYCYANDVAKTWFISKNKKVFLPKKSYLLLTISGEITNNPISVSNTYPSVGDVVCDLEGNHILIITIQ